MEREKIIEHTKSANFINLKNGNELLDLMKFYGIYNQIFKIEDSLKLENINNSVTTILEIISPSKSSEVESDITSNINPKIVLFNNYSEASENYYQLREIDKVFVQNLKLSNVWIWGKSGKGKTALINRNLIQNNIKYIFCDLSPISITHENDVLDEIICMIEQSCETRNCQEENNRIKRICKLIELFKSDKEIVIVIDELSVVDDNVLKKIADSFISLVTHYTNRTQNQGLRFVISTIAEPKTIISNMPKATNYFEFLSCDDWMLYINSLHTILNDSLNLIIDKDDNVFILKNSKENPRLLKNIVRGVYSSTTKTSKSIKEITQKAIEEYI